MELAQDRVHWMGVMVLSVFEPLDSPFRGLVRK
jgi:hypothetical protein